MHRTLKVQNLHEKVLEQNPLGKPDEVWHQKVFLNNYNYFGLKNRFLVTTTSRCIQENGWKFESRHNFELKNFDVEHSFFHHFGRIIFRSSFGHDFFDFFAPKYHTMKVFNVKFNFITNIWRRITILFFKKGFFSKKSKIWIFMAVDFFSQICW